MIYTTFKKRIVSVLFLSFYLIFANLLYAESNDYSGIYEYKMSGRAPFLHAIKSAKKSLKIAAYRLDDRGNQSIQGILPALLDAHRRGIKVQIILEKETYAHDKTGSSNTHALDLLEKTGIAVFDRPQWVDQTHHKIIIIDDHSVCLTTGNFDEESFDGDDDYSGSRDFTIFIQNPDMVKEIKAVFRADTQNKRINKTHPNLLWGPKGQREKFINLIQSAQNEILIYQQSIQDEGICTALLEKVKQGVSVKIVMMPFPFSKSKDPNFKNQMLLKRNGAEIGFLRDGTYVHAKVLIIDPGTENEKAYLGSCNFYKPSIDHNRELGVILTDSASIEELTHFHRGDFQKSLKTHPLEEKIQ